MVKIMSKRHTLEFIREEFKKHGLRLLETEYKNNKQKMRCLCEKHPDKVIFIRYNDLVTSNRIGCPLCGTERRARDKRKNFNEVEKCFEQRGYKLLSKKEEYINYQSELKFICLKHQEEGIQLGTYGNVKLGHSCKKCKSENLSESQRINFEIVEKAFKDRKYTLLSTKEDYKNRHSKLKYICPHHKDIIQEISWGNFRNGHGCRFCGCKNSEGERLIRDYLKNNLINFEEQKRFSDLRNPKTNYQLPYDFYIPETKTIIEFQGGYHDGKVHKRNPKKQTIEQLKDLQMRDRIKKEYACSHGYNFIEIWYWDIKNIEKILEKEVGCYKYSIPRTTTHFISE